MTEHFEQVKARMGGFFQSKKWSSLCNEVRAFGPDVIVLVARKMPRLAEVLNLEFGPSPVVITDLAIPFIASRLAGARVAVVDDVVNFGSTLVNAKEQVLAAGASECELYALADKNGKKMESRPSVHLTDKQSLDQNEYRDFVRKVPEASRLLCKPYDLDFPVFQCRLSPPLKTAHDLWESLSTTFGVTNLHHLSTSIEENSGLCRMSLDVSNQFEANMKVRLYFDKKNGDCTIVPMAVPKSFTHNPQYPKSTWPGALWLELKSTLDKSTPNARVWDNEPYTRAELFVHSVALGQRFLTNSASIFVPRGADLLDLDDAALIFGPNIARSLNSIGHLALEDIPELDAAAFAKFKNDTREPFISHIDESNKNILAESLNSPLAKGDYHTAFRRVFESLAAMVGAEDARKYSLSWPYTSGEITKRPYLRLRIGFTYHDLLSMFKKAVADKIGPMALRSAISELLDYYIDSGAIVPTIAKYENCCYRVYRKGENDFWDRATFRSMYAWHSTKVPMSLTRFAKIEAILSFSADVESLTEPSALERGSVGSIPQRYAADISGTEMGHYLRRTGRLKAMPHE